ncbi:MAG TPA: histidine kinase [Usitatibacter sp.]|jgi:two-component system sensor histidine kinase UhpB|nr:histidine kinase [Usitatibacter sp.]
MPLTAYRLLHVEDSADDADLVHAALDGAPFRFTLTRVDSEEAYIAGLDASPAPEAVLCDYNLPGFSAERALSLLKARGLEIPFIIVSHHLGETAAVVAMQQGADDYLPKRNLSRLTKALEAAIDRHRARRDKTRAIAALQASEAMKRSILNSIPTRVALVDGAGTIVAVNKSWEDNAEEFTALGLAAAAPGSNLVLLLREAAGALAAELAHGVESVVAGQSPLFTHEYSLKRGQGTRWFGMRVVPLENGAPGAVISCRDETDRTMTHLALHDAHARLQALSKRMLAIQEEERRAIARELHDDIGQTLGALKIGLHRVSHAGGREDAGAIVSECLAAADEALAKVRQLAMDLRPPQLDQLGLAEALNWLAQRQQAATGLAVGCRFSGLDTHRLPITLQVACYRIAQEGLSNATRHAQAARVELAVECDGSLLKLSVHDDGSGFDEEAARERMLKSGSMGLISMDERARLAGGRLKLRTVPGGGTTVSAIFPLAGAQTGERATTADATSP